eukprot:161994-Amphidinium_carterae.1
MNLAMPIAIERQRHIAKVHNPSATQTVQRLPPSLSQEEGRKTQSRVVASSTEVCKSQVTVDYPWVPPYRS